MTGVKWQITVTGALGLCLVGTSAAPQTLPSRTSAPKANVAAGIAGQVDPGARAFLQCRSCHTLKRGQADMVGPNLFGFFGTRVATHRPSFSYSAAARTSDVVWSDSNVDKWLEDPAAAIPGTSMAFAGIKRADTRAALIAYLKRQTQ
jgi:cytochrome c